MLRETNRPRDTYATATEAPGTGMVDCSNESETSVPIGAALAAPGELRAPAP